MLLKIPCDEVFYFCCCFLCFLFCNCFCFLILSAIINVSDHIFTRIEKRNLVFNSVSVRVIRVNCHVTDVTRPLTDYITYLFDDTATFRNSKRKQLRNKIIALYKLAK